MLLSLRNVQQSQAADCLAACTQSVLEYLGIQIDYTRLLKLLGTGDFGTSFPEIERLTLLGLFVECARHRDDKLLFAHHLELGLPVIVAVTTWPLPYWEQIDTKHAVIVVGFDDENVYINDPYFDEAPKIIADNDFFTAWSDRNFRYAIIGLVPPE